MINQAKLLRRPRADGRGGARAAALALCLVASAAQAGNISITMTTTAEVRDNAISVHLTVRNSGDEAASSVVPILRFGDREVRGTRQETLAPSQSIDDTLTLPQVTVGPGRWPFRVAVDYTDQNQYPFQALQTQAVIVGSPPPAKVVVPTIKSSDIAGSGTLTLTVKNLTADSHTAHVSVFVPEGLEATDPVREVTLEGWKQQDLEIPITNRTALAGSRYPVFVVVEYDDGAVHESAVAQGMVSVLEAQSFFSRNSRFLWIGAGVLIALWLAIVVMRGVGRSAGAQT
jgi:hypothetical protein